MEPEKPWSHVSELKREHYNTISYRPASFTNILSRAKVNSFSRIGTGQLLTKSDYINITSGIPQGSVLGSRLLLFTSMISQSEFHNLSTYVDDDDCFYKALFSTLKHSLHSYVILHE